MIYVITCFSAHLKYTSDICGVQEVIDICGEEEFAHALHDQRPWLELCE